jgi:hypothetical protein
MPLIVKQKSSDLVLQVRERQKKEKECSLQQPTTIVFFLSIFAIFDSTR